MKRFAKTCIAISCMLVAITARLAHAVESEVEGVQVGKDPVAAGLNELGVEYQRVADEAYRAGSGDPTQVTDEKLPDEEWLKQGRAEEAKIPDPDSELLPRFLAFAKNHPNSPYALDALAFAIRAVDLRPEMSTENRGRSRNNRSTSYYNSTWMILG